VRFAGIPESRFQREDSAQGYQPVLQIGGNLDSGRGTSTPPQGFDPESLKMDAFRIRPGNYGSGLGIEPPTGVRGQQ
jgi:hypothetical protein